MFIGAGEETFLIGLQLQKLEIPTSTARTRAPRLPHCFSIRISDRHSSSSFSGPIPRNLLGDFSQSSISFHGRRRNRDDGRRRRRHVTIFISHRSATNCVFVRHRRRRRSDGRHAHSSLRRGESINCHGSLTLTRRHLAPQFLLCKSSWSRVAP